VLSGHIKKERKRRVLTKLGGCGTSAVKWSTWPLATVAFAAADDGEDDFFHNELRLRHIATTRRRSPAADGDPTGRADAATTVDDGMERR